MSSVEHGDTEDGAVGVLTVAVVWDSGRIVGVLSVEIVGVLETGVESACSKIVLIVVDHELRNSFGIGESVSIRLS